MQKYKIIDRKAPRFRRAKFRYNLVNKELHKRFVEEIGIEVSWADFRKINQYINEEIASVSLLERQGCLLPEQMGNIWLGLFKMKERPLNKSYAGSTGEHATYFSFETFGMQGKICWDFKNCRYSVPNYRYWAFIAHRDLKQKASRAFKENPELYARINIKAIEYAKIKKLEDESNTQRSDISGEDPK